MSDAETRGALAPPQLTIEVRADGTLDIRLINAPALTASDEDTEALENETVVSPVLEDVPICGTNAQERKPQGWTISRCRTEEFRRKAEAVVDEKDRTIALEACAGMSAARIARRTGVSWSAVMYALRKVDGWQYDYSKRTQPRGRSIAPRRPLSQTEMEEGIVLAIEEKAKRPRTLGDCEAGGSNAQRPCPWVGCRHHLYLDVNPETGTIKLNFPHLEVDELRETCSLDVAKLKGVTLEEVGAIMNLTRERIRQVEVRGVLKLRVHVGGWGGEQ